MKAYMVYYWVSVGLTKNCFSLLLKFAFNNLLSSATAGLCREVDDNRHQISLLLQAVQEPLCYHRLCYGVAVQGLKGRVSGTKRQ